MAPKLKVFAESKYVNMVKSMWLFNKKQTINGELYTIQDGKLIKSESFIVNNEENFDYSVTDRKENKSDEDNFNSEVEYDNTDFKVNHKVYYKNKILSGISNISGIINPIDNGELELRISIDDINIPENAVIVILYNNTKSTPFIRIYDKILKFEEVDIWDIEDKDALYNSMYHNINIEETKRKKMSIKLDDLNTVALHYQKTSEYFKN